MVLVTYEAGLETQATAIVAAFGKEYGTTCPIAKVAVDAVWARAVEWDDLLIVVYQSAALPATLKDYVLAYRAAHPTSNPETKIEEPGGLIIPVSVSRDPARRLPPDPIAGIRSILYDPADEADALAETVRTAGIFLGLALRPGKLNIFISYRATDGNVLAQSLYTHLKEAGYNPFLDTAKEGLDLMIAAGMNVQDEIRKHVEDASLIILLDTPDAPASKWVSKEIDMANAMLVPVLPAVTDGERISRFIPLSSLRRVAALKAEVRNAQPLAAADLEEIRSNLETVLLEGYRRRLRVIETAKATFDRAGYCWTPVEEKMRIFSAERERSRRRGASVVLSHCSIHDIKYIPALQAYSKFIEGYRPIVNQRILLYDREIPLTDPEWDSIDQASPDLPFDLVHVSEIELKLHEWGDA